MSVRGYGMPRDINLQVCSARWLCACEREYVCEYTRRGGLLSSYEVCVYIYMYIYICVYICMYVSM